MSRKTQLPDELLDAISGGLLTYDGKEVMDMQSTVDGTTITMSDGSKASLDWNDQTRSRMYASLSSAVSTAKEIDGKHFSETQAFALEDYVK